MKFRNQLPISLCLIAPLMAAEAPTPKPDPVLDKAAFEQAATGGWRKVFSDPCTGDWRQQWFLDGEVGTVTTAADGMTLTAGPEFKNEAHHMVLWTKQSFEGNLKIEYDYTRKKDRDLFLRVQNPDRVGHYHFRNPRLPAITDGRVGLRHMFTRSAHYRNFQISIPRKLPEEDPNPSPAIQPHNP